MRYMSLILVFVTTEVLGATVGPDGVDSLATMLDGSGVLIGQAEFGRSSKVDYDSDNLSSSNTEPAGVYVQSHSGMAGMDELVNEHATLVAQQMIGSGLLGGVAPAATLHSLSLSDQNDDSLVALGLNRLALLNSGQVKAINISFFGEPQFLDNPDGNSYMTQFVDWSARQHDVLYVVAWGDADQPFTTRKPTDNFNGITVAASETVGAGPYGKFSVDVNAPEDDETDAQRIDILAPGKDVLMLPWNENVVSRDGTSFAAPTVVGTAALLQQFAQNQITASNPRFSGGANPNSQRHQVMKAVILNSADKIDGVHGSHRTVLDGAGNDWRDSFAYLSPSVALDAEMGAGHLNARRAVEQLTPGEYDPGVIPKIGWDYHTIGGSGSSNEYIFESAISGYIAVTLAWDRQTVHTENCGAGLFCEGDQFITGSLNERANNLDLRILPAASNNLADAVAASFGDDDTVEHIFFDLPAGMYKIVVTNTFFSGIGDSDIYALA